MLLLHLEILFYFFENCNLERNRYVHWVLENLTPLLLIEKSTKFSNEIWNNIEGMFKCILVSTYLFLSKRDYRVFGP